jgi:hypothetical protein
MTRWWCPEQAQVPFLHAILLIDVVATLASHQGAPPPPTPSTPHQVRISVYPDMAASSRSSSVSWLMGSSRPWV